MIDEYIPVTFNTDKSMAVDFGEVLEVPNTAPRANYNQTDPSEADYIIGRENILDKNEFHLQNGEANHALKQSRNPGSSQNHAYQNGGIALGGNTQAGVTEEEYNGSDKYKQTTGTKVLDYGDTFGFNFSQGDTTKARGRNAAAHNEATEANAKNSSSFGKKVIVDFEDGFGVGHYNENLADSIFEVGVGNSGWKQNGLAVDSGGTTKTRTVRPKASGSFDLGASGYVWRNIYTAAINASETITAGKIKIGSTTITEAQLVKLLALIN